MSRELLAIVESMNQESLEVQLALQCAPVLTGIKTGNLLIIKKEMADSFVSYMKGEHLCYYLLYEAEKLVYLIYDEDKLKAYLATRKVQTLLEILGYEEQELSVILEKIAGDYKSYMQRAGEFPHELGILLGYPVEDVVGFMDHQGKNFLYKGYWKVYENPERAKRLFAAYEEAKEQAIYMIFRGNSLKHLAAVK